MPSSDATTASVVIVGDGPTGLSAALFLAKNGIKAQVVGYNETPVHKAVLHNLLADDGAEGPAWLERAREHAQRFGAELHQGWVDGIDVGERFTVRTSERTFEGDYLVLATGFEKDLAQTLGLEATEKGQVKVDLDGRTSKDRIYAGGSLVRGMKTQAATSLGDGAAIALDILSRVTGKDHDFDVLKRKPEASASSAR